MIAIMCNSRKKGMNLVLYICLDTNIYISLMSNRLSYKFDDLQDTLGNPVDIIEEFQILNNYNAVKFLVPEIVELEINKSNQSIINDLETNYGKIIASIDNGCSEIWNEINAKELKGSLYHVIEKEKAKKLGHWNNMFTTIKRLFHSDRVDFVEFTPQIMCAAEKRKVEGLISETQMNDAYVMETIYWYCKKNNCTDVIFVTNDKKDYYDKKVGNCFTLKRRFVDPEVNVYGLYNIKQLPKYLNTVLDVSLPEDSVVYKISEEFDRKYPDWDFCDNDNTEGWKEYLKIEDENNKELIHAFENETEDFPEYIKKLRKQLLLDIQELLARCRERKSWDDRSELKLYQWLENRAESEIPLSKLSDLFLIKDNMQEYLQVHIDMDKAYNED